MYLFVKSVGADGNAVNQLYSCELAVCLRLLVEGSFTRAYAEAKARESSSYYKLENCKLPIFIYIYIGSGSGECEQ